MRIRHTIKFSSRAVFLAAVIGSGASPVLADCCDSWLDCAATVVTYGVSCEVETIISTIKNLLTVIGNVKDLATGTTNSAVKAAKQWVTSTHDSLQAQSQQGAANLAAAAAQAQTLYQEETMIRPVVSASVNSSNFARANPTTVSPPAGPAKPQTEMLVSKQGAAPPAAQPAPSGNSMQKTLVNPPTNVTTLQSTLPPPGSLAEEFGEAVKLIAALQSACASDVPTINQDLANAIQTEGVGEQSAQSIAANAINAPLDSVKDLLSSMLSNPMSAFDPSSQVQTVEDSVMNQLSTNVSTMVDDIMNGPKAAFAALAPSLGQLTDNSQAAQAIAAAMDRAYKQRTPAAVAALHALLPKTNYAGLTAKSTAAASLNIKLTNGLSYNDLLGQAVTTKQKATAGIAAQVQQFHAAATQLKAQVAQRKLAQSPSMLQTYRNSLTQQLSVALNGKSSAAVNAQRDQLIVQARSRYAQDSKTQSAVIALLNSEAAKRTGGPSVAVATNAAMATNAAVAAPTASATARSVSPASTLKPAVPRQVTAVAPQAVPLAPTAAPIAAPTAAPSTVPKATAWGSAPPAWTPPVSSSAAKAPVAAPAMGAVRPVPGTALPAQTLQPVKPVTAVQPAPSSLTHP